MQSRQDAQWARAASKDLVSAKFCSDCKEQKPLDEFKENLFRCTTCRSVKSHQWRENQKINNPYDKRKYLCKHGCGNKVAEKDRSCWQCYVEERRVLASSKPKVKRPSSVTKSVPRPTIIRIPQQHDCLGGCGRPISIKQELCQGCKKAKQVAIAANAERQIKTKRAAASLESGTTLGLLWVGEEALLLQYRCINPLCKKPVIVHGKCYKCATGREKVLKILPVIEYHTSNDEALAS